MLAPLATVPAVVSLAAARTGIGPGAAARLVSRRRAGGRGGSYGPGAAVRTPFSMRGKLP
jgi:hypothetical protein